MEKEYALTLTDGRKVQVDAEAYRKLSRYTWYSVSLRGTANRVVKGNKRIMLHREIANPPPGMHVGFLDGDKYNCKLSNLFLHPPGKAALVRRQILSAHGVRELPKEGHPVCALPLVGGGEVLVDPDDYERFKAYTWSKYNGCAFTKLPPNDRQVFLHREIMGHPKGLYVGFLNGVRLDCRRSNLYCFVPGMKEETRKQLLKDREQLTKAAARG